MHEILGAMDFLRRPADPACMQRTKLFALIQYGNSTDISVAL